MKDEMGSMKSLMESFSGCFQIPPKIDNIFSDSSECSESSSSDETSSHQSKQPELSTSSIVKADPSIAPEPTTGLCLETCLRKWHTSDLKSLPKSTLTSKQKNVLNKISR